MPTQNPRITITLEPQVHAMLRELSRLAAQSQSALVGELLEQCMPVMQRMVDVLRAAEQLKQQGAEALAEVSSGLEHAQTKLEAQLGLALETIDGGFRPILDAAETVQRRAGRPPAAGAAGAGGRAVRRRGTPPSNRGVGSPVRGPGKGRGKGRQGGGK